MFDNCKSFYKNDSVYFDNQKNYCSWLKKNNISKNNFDIWSIYKYLFIYLFHTSICHQSRVGLCGELTNIISNKNNKKTLKFPKNFKIKNFINCSISLNMNSTFIHLCVDNAASTIENLNKTEFWQKKHLQ